MYPIGIFVSGFACGIIAFVFGQIALDRWMGHL